MGKQDRNRGLLGGGEIGTKSGIGGRMEGNKDGLGRVSGCMDGRSA